MTPELKRYKKAQKKYIKDLIKYIYNEENPYCSNQIPIVILKMLKRRLEYFEANDNVCMDEDTRAEIVKTLRKAVNLGITATDNANSYSIALETEGYENIRHTDLDEFQQMYDKQITAYRAWFNYIARHFMEWWD